MAEVSQTTEIETSCDVSIAIHSDRTSMEQKILRVPHQLLKGIEDVCQLAKTETSCHISIAIQNDRTSLEQKLTLLWTAPRERILRVPSQLREVNEKAYEPCVISIGPYHRAKDHLKEMEGQKVRCLNTLLQSTNQRVEHYLSEIEPMVGDARDYYSEPLEISKKEFVEMMVLDGCFIIQFFMGKLGDSFYYRGLIRKSILRDLVLVENQLPFFVLGKLLDIIPQMMFNMGGFTDPKRGFICHLIREYTHRMPGLRIDTSHTTYDENSIKEIKHIVHLLHSNWRPSKKATEEYNKMRSKDEHLKWEHTRCATELREAGIEFKKLVAEGNVEESLFDFNFKNGILELPTVKISDSTESLYRNLIACEQFDSSDRFLTEYVTLMDSLINSGKDVGLLCKSGIIDNWLGDDESVAVLFNRLRDHTILRGDEFFYAQLFRDVNRHCKKPWNRWKANLSHNYFNTPWTFISFLAATLLLLLTVLQTSFTIFPRS